ncbi:hypothetical protein CROQUDRAFT_133441 [Cronartium quercuum f. sp. fusiforme G11]|uniref:Uncharacterized protein n=1 Tax=Cronartium quercuum f. sp. fusiforme G11 TaxID=708437 RepID=A0A9P6NFK6_9BASI|nr:hypothetical protein CROQUDRAFT_133441 [Cronartium quercuum f. sp. fusiforme G11]
MSQLAHEPSSDVSAASSASFTTPQLGQIGTLFENREHFIRHAKQTATNYGFHLASRGSYPKKPRQDICFACTVGRNYKRPKKNSDGTEIVNDQPYQKPCPVAVTAKWQVKPDGSLVEGGKFEITQSTITHNHPPITLPPLLPPISPPQSTLSNSHSSLSHHHHHHTQSNNVLPVSIPHNGALELDSLSVELEEHQNPNHNSQTNLLSVPHSRLASGSGSIISAPPSSSPPPSPSSVSTTRLAPLSHSSLQHNLVMDPTSYPHHNHTQIPLPAEQTLSPDSIPENRLIPSLPQVGDVFKSWDDFRIYARQAAEVRGFALSQSQSKGSSGTIVLRCSRFKEPGTAGQKMAENGCEVFFKVMKAKNGVEGFEVTQAYEQHNHEYGPHIPIVTQSRTNPGQTTNGPKRKKAKSSHPIPDSTQPNEASTPSGGSSTAPKPFLFDPYTGKPLRSSNTPAPGPSDQTTPSPPSETGVQSNAAIHMSTVYSGSVTGPAYVAGGHFYGPTPYGQPVYEGLELNLYQQQQSAILNQQTRNQPTQSRKRQNPTKSGNIQTQTQQITSYQPLNVRFTPKAQTQITDFLTTLSPNLTPYGQHFIWLGINSPLDLLNIEINQGLNELECILDELDTSGFGLKGEGFNYDEKILIFRGLKKLKMIREKAS